MGRKVYTNEFKAEVIEYYKTHTVEETMQKFGIPKPNASKWALKAGVNKGKDKYTLSFKHEACQYYEHHTGEETCAKFGINTVALCDWRKKLGYRNKHFGRNMNVNTRTPLHFKSTRGEDGKYKLEVLQKRITDLETQIATMQPDVELAKSIRSLFN